MNSCPFPSVPSLIVALSAAAIPSVSMGQSLALDSLEGLRAHNVSMDVSTHDGRTAVHVSDSAAEGAGEDTLVLIDGLEFQDGMIEIDLVGAPGQHAGQGARGFVGVAFRVRYSVPSTGCTCEH